MIDQADEISTDNMLIVNDVDLLASVSDPSSYRLPLRFGMGNWETEDLVEWQFVGFIVG